mmetsp:Transcript_49771/g.113275  ORF Transcript_49771/g.113275 Transcript_49771/m.113275 type:complete len:260 (+) Transcript_49771:265-1044(+)
MFGGFDHVFWHVLHQLLEFVGLRLDEAIELRTFSRERRQGLIVVHILRASWQDAGLHHLDERCHLNLDCGVVVFVHHLLARITLLGRKHAQGLEHVLVLLGVEGGCGQRCCVQIGKAALLGLCRPLGGVAVACEDDVAVLLVKARNGITVAHATLDKRGERCHARCHYGVDDGYGKRTVLGGPYSAELEAVTAEGEWRSAIAVLHTAWSTHGGPGLGIGCAFRCLVAKQRSSGDDRVYVRLETGAWIEGDDGRWGLLGA